MIFNKTKKERKETTGKKHKNPKAEQVHQA